LEHAKAFVTSKGEDSFHILASNDSVDRDGESIQHSAWEKTVEDFKQNPVLLWAHDYSKPPIGAVENLKVTGNGLEGDIRFANTDFAQDIKGLYADGIMSSFSVGFLPKQRENVEGVPTYTEVELLEISAVPVPANRAARVMRAMKSAADGELPPIEEGESTTGYQWRMLRDGYMEPDDPEPDEYIQELAEECRSLAAQIERKEQQIDDLVQSTKLGTFRDTQGATNEQR
jgi:HK97 family phage prohead protease